MANPTDLEQYIVELTNRFRIDPGGAYDRVVDDEPSSTGYDPTVTAALQFFNVNLDLLKEELGALPQVQPLVWNDDLNEAAQLHTQRMKNQDSQSHQLPGEGDLGERVRDAGYMHTRATENVFAFGETPLHIHQAFTVDWGEGPNGMQSPRGHRENLIEAGMREIGVGSLTDNDPSTSVGPILLTENLGVRSTAGPFLLGAAFKDKDRDDHFSFNEGMGGMKVKVGGRGGDKTAPSGGYGVETGEGTFNVILKGRPVKGKIQASVEIGEDNFKIDLMDKKHLFTTGSLDLRKGAASVTALGSQDVDLSGKKGRDNLIGNAGSNTLDGEGGRDRIDGGAGADVIIGGKGNDKLKGGGGNDEFVFGLRDGKDSILDWNDGDRISIDGDVTAQDIDISARRGDAVVSFGATVVTVEDQAGEITLDDLLF